MDPTSSPASSGEYSGIGSDVNDISPAAFYSLTWIFFALCTIAFGARVCIRYVCLRRLMLEDYLMFLALLMHNVEAVLAQLYVKYVFDLEAVQRGDMSRMTADFLSNTHQGFIALGICSTMSMIGVLIVKVTFLLFFRRIGANTGKRFNIIWWGVVLFTVASAVAQLAIIEYRCFYTPIDSPISLEVCSSEDAMRKIMTRFIFSAVQDAVSDFLIIGFPVAILWRSGIELRKKLILSFIFGMVSFTIAVTIVRGSVFTKVWSKQANGQLLQQSASFTWFWFYTEFSVAIIIACVVSFRTLFVNRDHKAKNRFQEMERRNAFLASKANKRWQNKVRQLHHSLLDTCRDLEGADWDNSRVDTVAMEVPSGLMTVDFNDDTNWTKTITSASTNHINDHSSVKPSVSMQSLMRNETSISADRQGTHPRT